MRRLTANLSSTEGALALLYSGSCVLALTVGGFWRVGANFKALRDAETLMHYVDTTRTAEELQRLGDLGYLNWHGRPVDLPAIVTLKPLFLLGFAASFALIGYGAVAWFTSRRAGVVQTPMEAFLKANALGVSLVITVLFVAITLLMNATQVRSF